MEPTRPIHTDTRIRPDAARPKPRRQRGRPGEEHEFEDELSEHGASSREEPRRASEPEPERRPPPAEDGVGSQLDVTG